MKFKETRARKTCLYVTRLSAVLLALVAGSAAEASSAKQPQSSQQSVLGKPDADPAQERLESARTHRGVPWLGVPSRSDVLGGGVAGPGPECLCDRDCDMGCGICTGGVCAADPSPANGRSCDDGDADGLFCTTGLCTDGACIAAKGGGLAVCQGANETCNDVDDRCENCVDDTDCPVDAVEDPCGPEICDPTTKRCVFDLANDPCPEQNCEEDPDNAGQPLCSGAPDEGRCCLPNGDCLEDQTRAECDGAGGVFFTLNFCPCPKYSAGVAPDAVAQGQTNVVFELLIEEPGDACETRSILFDDYSLANGSFLALEGTTIAGVAEGDNTSLEIKYYDTNFNLITTDPFFNIDTGPIIFISTPIGSPVIPPEGWVSVEVTSNTGGFSWHSADGVDIGTNILTELRENDNAPGPVLPGNQNVMRLEIIGTKTTEPEGVCCSPDGKSCTPDMLPWECGAGSFVLDGVCPGACDAGSCCLPSGLCCDSSNADTGAHPDCTSAAITSQGGCEAVNGSFNGFATDCSLDCCPQTASGSTVCANATDHFLDISGGCAPNCPEASVTITGDNRGITNGLCDVSGTPCATNTVPGQPNSCPKGEVCVPNADYCSDFWDGGAEGDGSPSYYERFTINEWAEVTVDYCGSGTCPGMDPGPGPAGGQNIRFIVLLDDCQAGGDPANCGEPIFRDIDASNAVVCPDQNAADKYLDLAPGTYYAPIFSGKACSFTLTECIEDSDCAEEQGETCENNQLNYQMHITAKALPPQACCQVDPQTGPFCSLLTRPECELAGGFSIDNAPICTPGACDTGACCTGPGACDDDGGVGITFTECDDILGGTYFGAALCNDNPCPVCTIDEPGNCQDDSGGFILPADRALNDDGLPEGLWADDFRPQGAGPVILDTVCWNPCFFNPFDTLECTDDPPPDNFDITIYEDAGGLPGVEVGGGAQPLNVIAKEAQGGGSRCWQYSGMPSAPPTINGGGCYWIQIMGVGLGEFGGGCTVYWLTSTDGNHYFATDNDGTWGPEDVVLEIGGDPNEADLSFCVNTGLDSGNGCGTFTGACCVCGQACQNNSDPNTCVDQGGTYFPGVDCNQITCPEENLPNDDCAAAEVLTHLDKDPANDIVVGFDTRCATTDGPDAPFAACSDTGAGGADPFANDLWYEYSPPCCGQLRASLCPGDGTGANALYDSQLVLYGGLSTCSCPDDMTVEIACSDSGCGIGTGPSLIDEEVFEGNCYLLRLGGAPDAGTGTMVVSIECGECPADVGRPNPDPELGLGSVAGSTVQPCVTIDDCSNFGTPPNVACIPQANGLFPGTCYVSASRYLSIAPNPDNGTTARRISLDIDGDELFDPMVDHVLGWMAAPTPATVAGPEASPQAQARMSTTPVFRDWNDLTDIHATMVGAVPVRLGDCEIAPKGGSPETVGNVYFVQAINQGDDTAVENNFSPPLVLRTTTRSSDVSGTGAGSNYPNQGVSLLDAFSIVQGFQGTQSIPKWRLEQDGGQTPPTDNIPNFSTVSLLDVFFAVNAFQTGGNYASNQPCACTGQVCP